MKEKLEKIEETLLRLEMINHQIGYGEALEIIGKCEIAERDRMRGEFLSLIKELEEITLADCYIEATKLNNNERVAVTLHYKGFDYTIKPMRLGVKIKRLEEENKRLRNAITKTIEDNLHLADGDVCTLIELKRAINYK